MNGKLSKFLRRKAKLIGEGVTEYVQGEPIPVYRPTTHEEMLKVLSGEKVPQEVIGYKPAPIRLDEHCGRYHSQKLKRIYKRVVKEHRSGQK